MDQQLYVRIENKSLIPFFDPAKEASHRLTLTTIKDNQRTAIVTIYRKDPAGAEIELKRYTVTPIPLAEAGVPKISLEAVKVSSRRVEIRLSLNRRSVAVETLRLPPSGNRAWWLLVPLALLLLSALVVLILPSRSVAGPGPAGGTAAERPRSETQQSPGRAAATQTTRPKPPPPQPSNPAPPRPTPAQPAEPRVGESDPSSQRLRGTEPAGPGTSLPASEPSVEAEPEPEAAPVPEPPRLPPGTVRELVYFGPDSAELSPEATAALRDILPVLRRYPGARITLRGHCAPRGTEEGRQELSEARAAGVAAFLREAGIKIEKSRVTGLGAREPVSLLEKDEHLNRRVEIILEGA